MLILGKGAFSQIKKGTLPFFKRLFSVSSEKLGGGGGAGPLGLFAAFIHAICLGMWSSRSVINGPYVCILITNNTFVRFVIIHLCLPMLYLHMKANLAMQL